MNYESQEEFEHFEGAMEQSVPQMNNQEIEVSEWEKKFSELNIQFSANGYVVCLPDDEISRIKSFIRSLLSSARADLIREIEEILPEDDDGINPFTKMPDYSKINIGYKNGWDSCLATIKKSLADMK